MRLRGWIVLAVTTATATVTALGGCSGSSSNGDVCGTPPTCSNATFPSTSEQQACTVQINDPQCGAAFRDMKECQTFRAKCTSSGAFSSSATNAACRTEINAYTNCTGSPVDAGGTDSCSDAPARSKAPTAVRSTTDAGRRSSAVRARTARRAAVAHRTDVAAPAIRRGAGPSSLAGPR